MLSRYVGVATLAYGALAAGAFGISWLAGEGLPWSTDPWLPWTRGARIALAIVGGLVLAIAVILATRWLVRRGVGWARDLHVAFRGVLGPLTSREIVIFALLSGVAEELFFRGALLPTLGFWVSSLIFGLLHVGPSRRFVPWTVSALVMGLAFGALFAATGELVGCVLAHVLINHENMHFIEAYEPREQAQVGRPRSDGPAVVGRRRHRSGGLMHPGGGISRDV